MVVRLKSKSFLHWLIWLPFIIWKTQNVTYPENALRGDINRRIIENSKRTHIVKANHNLKVQNVTFKLSILRNVQIKQKL